MQNNGFGANISGFILINEFSNAEIPAFLYTFKNIFYVWIQRLYKVLPQIPKT